jgi:hypothetical protein
MTNQFWSYDGMTYTDITTGTHTIFSANGDIVYIGSDDLFNTVIFSLDVVASGDGIQPFFAIWDGSVWQNVISAIDSTNGLTSNGYVTFSPSQYNNWVKNDVNGVVAYYFRIIRSNAAGITAPVESAISISAVDNSQSVTSLIPSLPLDRKIVDEDGRLTDGWHQFLDQLISSMKLGFSNEGYQMPRLDAANIAFLTDEQSLARFLMDNTDPNNTAMKVNLNVSGVPTWKTITTS